MHILTYTILYSWGNQQSLTIALFAYTHHVPGRLVLQLLILRMQSSKFYSGCTEKYSTQGEVLCHVQHHRLCLVFYLTPPLVLYFVYITVTVL